MLLNLLGTGKDCTDSRLEGRLVGMVIAGTIGCAVIPRAVERRRAERWFMLAVVITAAVGCALLAPLRWLPAQALVLVVMGAARVRTDAALAGDRRRMAALSVAVLLSVQLAANYWAFMYVSWFAPLIALLLATAPAERARALGLPSA